MQLATQDGYEIHIYPRGLKSLTLCDQITTIAELKVMTRAQFPGVPDEFLQVEVSDEDGRTYIMAINDPKSRSASTKPRIDGA